MLEDTKQIMQLLEIIGKASSDTFETSDYITLIHSLDQLGRYKNSDTHLNSAVYISEFKHINQIKTIVSKILDYVKITRDHFKNKKNPDWAKMDKIYNGIAYLHRWNEAYLKSNPDNLIENDLNSINKILIGLSQNLMTTMDIGNSLKFDKNQLSLATLGDILIKNGLADQIRNDDRSVIAMSSTCLFFLALFKKDREKILHDYKEKNGVLMPAVILMLKGSLLPQDVYHQDARPITLRGQIEKTQRFLTTDGIFKRSGTVGIDDFWRASEEGKFYPIHLKPETITGRDRMSLRVSDRLLYFGSQREIEGMVKKVREYFN